MNQTALTRWKPRIGAHLLHQPSTLAFKKRGPYLFITIWQIPSLLVCQLAELLDQAIGYQGWQGPYPPPPSAFIWMTSSFTSLLHCAWEPPFPLNTYMYVFVVAPAVMPTAVIPSAAHGAPVVIFDILR